MRVGLGAGEFEDGFDEMLGLRAGDEDIGGDAKGEAEELLRASEVLERMLGGAAGDERAEGAEVSECEVVFAVGEEPGAVAMEDVGEQGLGVAAGDRGGGFEERVAEGHAVERIAVRDCDGFWERPESMCISRSSILSGITLCLCVNCHVTFQKGRNACAEFMP